MAKKDVDIGLINKALAELFNKMAKGGGRTETKKEKKARLKKQAGDDTINVSDPKPINNDPDLPVTIPDDPADLVKIDPDTGETTKPNKPEKIKVVVDESVQKAKDLKEKNKQAAIMAGKKQEQAVKRRKGLIGRRKTILTSPLGVTDEPVLFKKSLLGL